MLMMQLFIGKALWELFVVNKKHSGEYEVEVVRHALNPDHNNAFLFNTNIFNHTCLDERVAMW